MNALSPKISADLLRVDVQSLLAAFGAGLPTPGAGSAAALNGALACEVISSSAKLTISKTRDMQRQKACEYVIASVASKRPVLQGLVQRDADVFSEVIAARRARDRARSSDLRRRHAARARHRLNAATDIAVRIARECVGLARLGIIMVEVGYAAAKGDPAAGVSNALAGAQTAICAALLNIGKSRGGRRARNAYAELEIAFAEMLEIQEQLMQSVVGLRRQAGEALSLQLRLF
jgi:formiminotetrahydrofolate cyclodeaminase